MKQLTCKVGTPLEPTHLFVAFECGSERGLNGRNNFFAYEMWEEIISLVDFFRGIKATAKSSSMHSIASTRVEHKWARCKHFVSHFKLENGVEIVLLQSARSSKN